MPFNRYATILDTWACGRFVYVRFVTFVTVFWYNSCLCATVISVDSVLATTHAGIVHSHAKWQMMTAVLRVWLRNCRLITSFYCYTLLVLHIPVLFLWSSIFRSCIFRSCYLVLHFQVLHFHVVTFGPAFSGPEFSIFKCFVFFGHIFRSCICSCPRIISSQLPLFHKSMPHNYHEPKNHNIWKGRTDSLFNLLFNCFIDPATVSAQWKRAFITPIPKVINPTSAVDYRPISITPVLSRILEKRIVRKYIYPALYIPLRCCSPDLPPLLGFSDQYGFRPTRSTTRFSLRLFARDHSAM